MPRADPNGSYDPDLVRDPTTGRLWMSYSGVDGPAGEGLISTHLAYSDDNGRTWCHQGVVNAATRLSASELPAGRTAVSAHWSHETSTLAYDPDAPEETRWWLAWNRYLHLDDGNPLTDDRRFEHGWIAVRRAATPEGLFDAEETKLFAGLGYSMSPEVRAWNEAAPGGSPEHSWATDAHIGGCIVLIESSLLAWKAGLLWASYCIQRTGERQIVSAQWDRHSGQWHSSRVLFGGDSFPQPAPPVEAFNGPDLFVVGEALHISVTPVAGLYRGCLVFRVPDEGPMGPPLATIDATPGSNILQSGPCAYADDTVMGLLSGDTQLQSPQFVMKATGIELDP